MLHLLFDQRLHTNEATLLPKLRVDFAEFLNWNSSERLRILTLTYLCRFIVRPPYKFMERGFSCQRGIDRIAAVAASRNFSALERPVLS